MNPELRRAFDKSASDEWKSMIESFAEAWGVSTDDASAVFWLQIDYTWTHWSQFGSLKSQRDEKELENIVSLWYSCKCFIHPILFVGVLICQRGIPFQIDVPHASQAKSRFAAPA